jgi:hypothetical protein
VNEFGASFLPYPGKGSTIGDIVGWFDREVQELSATLMKANKTFACYDIIGILWMLYNSDCGYLEGLQSILTLCDTSILDDLPSELTKLTGQLVRKWWVEHGLPKAASHLRKEMEVSLSLVCCNSLMFCDVIHLTYIFYVPDRHRGDRRDRGC